MDGNGKSLPVRGEWIEILADYPGNVRQGVSPREGRVD